jgi:hypothetical protein
MVDGELELFMRGIINSIVSKKNHPIELKSPAKCNEFYEKSKENWKNFEIGRWGSGEMGKWGDGEVGRWGSGEMGRWGDGEVVRRGSE